jgi:hypothetical protein
VLSYEQVKRASSDYRYIYIHSEHRSPRDACSNSNLNICNKTSFEVVSFAKNLRISVVCRSVGLNICPVTRPCMAV